MNCGDVDTMRQHYGLQMLEKHLYNFQVICCLHLSKMRLTRRLNITLREFVCAQSVVFQQSHLPVNVVWYINFTGWKLQNLFHRPNVLLRYWQQRNELRGQACQRYVVDWRHVQFNASWNQICDKLQIFFAFSSSWFECAISCTQKTKKQSAAFIQQTH